MKKPDRRTIYTKNAVKDAMLEMLKQGSFEKITVSALCRRAEVGRATFYMHYENLMQVIDELADDAIKTTNRGFGEDVLGIHKAAQELLAYDHPQDLEEFLLLLPVCQRVADNPKYNVLFKDPFLSEYLLMQIYRSKRAHMLPQLMRFGLSEKQADMLFLFNITGAFAVNRAMGWKKDAEWLSVQKVLLNFLDAGYAACQKEAQRKPAES